ncbi:hypothetical protein L3X38_007873 [Prunus dulcis]|uniref:Uncharacterized protein n=1 Tax=Prunus dulcis TaxID=3755 RepID=A0AAD5F6K1_PRUDU|nr:hypothetical protein L3X38_007873 [Prunus dulcis]
MEGSDQAPHDIENPCIPLVTSMSEELDGLSSLSSSCCIYRVPERLRRVSENAYTPQVVSIGPLHHGEEGLKAMEDHKKRYLQDYIRRTRDENDRIFNRPWMLQDLWPDMRLLENQLPFFILEELFVGVTYGSAPTDADFNPEPDPESGSSFDDPHPDPDYDDDNPDPDSEDDPDPDSDDDPNPEFVSDSDPDPDFDSDFCPDSGSDSDPNSYSTCILCIFCYIDYDF